MYNIINLTIVRKIFRGREFGMEEFEKAGTAYSGVNGRDARVQNFLTVNGKYFDNEQLVHLRERLYSISEDRFSMLGALKFKSPGTALALSIFFGGIGVDRFYIGDTGMGLGKLFTGGGCGIWAFVDWFLIKKAARRKNYEKLMAALL